MKNSVLIGGIIFCIQIISGCGKDNKPQEKKELSEQFLKLSDSLVFHLSDSVLSDFLELQYVEELDMIVVNGRRNIITWFDMKTGLPLRSKRLDREGPNGVGKMKDFYYPNCDSMFIFGRYDVALLDSAHQVMTRYKVRKSGERRGTTTATLRSTATLNQAILLDSHLIVSSFGDYPPHENGYSSDQAVTKLNLASGSYKHYGGYSEAYKDGSTWSLEQCFHSLTYVPDTKHIIISYPIDPQVHFMDAESIAHAKTAKSGFFDKCASYQGNMQNTAKRIHHYLTNYSYGSLLYDHYRKVFLRISYFPLNDLTVKDIEKTIQTRNFKFYRTYSISLFSKDMEKIGEQAFSGKKYSSNKFIIHPKGLYIQSARIPNEDERIFYLMSFSDEALQQVF